MVQPGRDVYQQPPAKVGWSGHVRIPCTEGHLGTGASQKSDLYPRALRGHKANGNWEQRLPEASVTQPPFAQSWERECPTAALQSAKIIQVREAKAQGQRPLTAPRGDPGGNVLSTANLYSVPFQVPLSLRVSLSTCHVLGEET